MPLKLNSSSGGSVTLASPATASDFSITMPASNGTVLMTPLPAGNTSQAPLKFTSGTNLTTADAGSFEYNGKTLLFTPQGTQRGVVPGTQIFRLGSNLTGLNATGAQNTLGVGVTLSSNTSYYFEHHATFSKSAGTTSHTFSHSWGGTATLNNINYTYHVIYTNNGTLVTNAVYGNRLVSTSFPSAVMTGAITSAAYAISVIIRGVIDVATGGTVIPQYSLSAAPGGAYLTEAGSYMLIYPIGTSTASANLSVGAWA